MVSWVTVIPGATLLSSEVTSTGVWVIALPTHAEGCGALFIPVPDKLTPVGELEALLTIETLPEALPVAVGAKVALKFVD